MAMLGATLLITSAAEAISPIWSVLKVKVIAYPFELINMEFIQPI